MSINLIFTNKLELSFDNFSNILREHIYQEALIIKQNQNILICVYFENLKIKDNKY